MKMIIALMIFLCLTLLTALSWRRKKSLTHFVIEKMSKAQVDATGRDRQNTTDAKPHRQYKLWEAGAGDTFKQIIFKYSLGFEPPDKNTKIFAKCLISLSHFKLLSRDKTREKL